MSTETRPHTNREKVKRILRLILIYFLFLALFESGKFLIEDRCSLLSCEPASWSKIQGIVINKTSSWGNEYRLDENPIHIDFSNHAGLNKSDLLDKTNLNVTYIATKYEYGEAVYPERILEFDDKNLWIDSHKRSSALISLPSEEILNRFKRVSVGYRDVYEITWDKAIGQLQSPIIFVSVALSLGDENLENLGVESEWFIIYLDKSKNSVSYWVDAQSGKILHTR